MIAIGMIAEFRFRLRLMCCLFDVQTSPQTVQLEALIAVSHRFSGEIEPAA